MMARCVDLTEVCEILFWAQGEGNPGRLGDTVPLIKLDGADITNNPRKQGENSPFTVSRDLICTDAAREH